MLTLAEIPNSSTDLVPWLECQLVGLRLRDLVIELVALQERAGDNRGTRTALGQLLGDNLQEVMDQGLGAASTGQVQALLRQPELLLQLQSRILAEGGDYWDRLPRAAEHEAANGRVLATLQRPPLQPETSPAAPVRTRRYPAWAAPLAVAAALFIAIGFWMLRPSPAPGWGFDRPGALAVDLPPGKYLNHLADSAGDWFKKRPDTREALAARIRQFRLGCETLLAAQHPQLNDADRSWLKERCQAWIGKLDSHLADLEDPTKDVETVRSAADATIKQLVTALRNRAESA
jgi:hypothetical protein